MQTKGTWWRRGVLLVVGAVAIILCRPSPKTSPGETVIWNFQAFHTSTSDTATGPEVWDSGILSTGTFSHTFQTPGTYPYYCQVHSFPGGTAMNGAVVVQGGVPTPTSTPIPATSTPVPPTSTPSESATPVVPGSPIPTLDGRGRILFVLALLAAGVTALSLSSRR